jgi:thioredoxin-like negative regulator of GroEL
MFSFSKSIFALGRSSSLAVVVMLTITLCSHTASHAQGLNGLNSTGTSGNEVIQGKIYFPRGHTSAMRPVVKLQSDSSTELTTVATFDGSFTFTHLRPGSYRIIVNGGDEYENAFDTVAVGSAGPVPAQGSPSQYAMPVVYQVQIYLQPKGTLVSNSNAGPTQAALAILPGSVRDLFNQGVESARLGNHTKAIEQFKEVISQAPDFELAYNEMGVQYLTLGQADKAAEALAKAVKLAPEEFVAHLNYGIALLNLDKFADAEKQLRQALQKNPAAPTGHYYVALALMKQNEFEAAEAEFKLSITNSNDRPAPAHKYLGGIYWHNKQYSRAADELTKYIELEPNAADAARIRETIKDLRARK